jgi:hypothetical protein
MNLKEPALALILSVASAASQHQLERLKGAEVAIKRTTRITVETRRTLVITRRPDRHAGWCELCDARVNTITPVEAARFSKVSLSTI